MFYGFAFKHFRQQVFEYASLGFHQSIDSVLMLFLVDIYFGSRLDLLFFRDFSECSTEIRFVVIRVLPKFTMEGMPLLFNLAFLPILGDDVLNCIGRQGL